MLYQTALTLHFISILITGGGMIGVILAERRLWKKLGAGTENPAPWIELIQAATKFILIGLALFLLSGLALLYSNNWVYIDQIWFIVKFGCFVLFAMSGALVGGKTIELIDKQLREKNYNMKLLMKAKSRMGRFYIIQFLLVTVIIVLGVFKPLF